MFAGKDSDLLIVLQILFKRKAKKQQQDIMTFSTMTTRVLLAAYLCIILALTLNPKDADHARCSISRKRSRLSPSLPVIVAFVGESVDLFLVIEHQA